MRITQSLKPLAVLVVISLFTGCSTLTQEQQFGDFEKQLQMGEVHQASSYAVQQAAIDPGTGKATDLLWSLQAGAVLRTQGGYGLSSQYFDDAEALIKRENTKHQARKLVGEAGSLLVNDTILDYSPAVYDGIMANTYKALNFMAEGKTQDARIEWNRVDDRQRRAADHFAKQITKLKAEQAKETGENRKLVEQSLKSSQSILQEQGVDMAQWGPYKNYVNPFSTYMHGLFFMLNAQTASDYSKAYDSMKRAYGLTGNAAVKTDMKMARKLVRGGRLSQEKSTVWVVFENGLSVKKDEFRIDLPIFLLDDGSVKYTGIALPELVDRSQAYSYLQVGKFKTAPLASMDKIIRAEFKEAFPYILGKELARATAKTLLQKELYDEDDPLAGILAAAYQLGTTSADIRMWTSLPSEFQLARFPKNGNKLVLNANGMQHPVEVALGKNSRFDIVYVKAFSAAQKPNVQVFSI